MVELIEANAARRHGVKGFEFVIEANGVTETVAKARVIANIGARFPFKTAHPDASFDIEEISQGTTANIPLTSKYRVTAFFPVSTIADDVPFERVRDLLPTLS